MGRGRGGRRRGREWRGRKTLRAKQFLPILTSMNLITYAISPYIPADTTSQGGQHRTPIDPQHGEEIRLVIRARHRRSLWHIRRYLWRAGGGGGTPLTDQVADKRGQRRIGQQLPLRGGFNCYSPGKMRKPHLSGRHLTPATRQSLLRWERYPLADHSLQGCSFPYRSLLPL